MDSAARFCLSDELHKAGQLASALEQARTAAALKPGTAWYHHHLAHLLMLSARYAEASKAIAESVELEPKRAAHHYIRGEVMLKLGDSAGAKIFAACHGMRRRDPLAFPPPRPCLRALRRHAGSNERAAKGYRYGTRQRGSPDGAREASRAAGRGRMRTAPSDPPLVVKATSKGVGSVVANGQPVQNNDSGRV